MATLGSLIISLEANTAKFESAMTKAEYAAKKASDNILGAFKILGAGLAAAFSVSTLDAAFDRITKAESDLMKMATRLNTNVETLSSFSVMIRKTGMDADTFYTTLTRMDKGLSAAALGAEQATGKYDENGEEIQKTAKAYDELGIRTQELIKLPWAERLLAISAAMKENVAPQDQVRIAMEMGGRSAAGMVNIFREGPDAMQKWTDRAKELGIVTTDMAGRAQAARSAAADLSLAWENFARQLVDLVAPAITKVLNLLTALATSKTTTLNIAVETVWEHAEETKEAFVGPPLPAKMKIPPEVFKPPERQKPTAVKGGGGGGAGDMGLDRMRSIIDTLQKDLSRLTEGSLAEIREWANHTRNEIEKVGRKGAETEEAMKLVATVEGKKKEKAVEDYYLFVAKESGDNYKQIEADAKEWLTKYKGFADAEANVTAIKNRKMAEEDNRQNTERLGLQKSLLDSIGQEMPFLSQRLDIMQKVLPLEIEMNKLALDRAMASIKLNESQKDELRGLLAIATAAKKYSVEKAKWAKEGIGGGLRIGAEEIRKSAETFSAETTAKLAASMPYEISSLLASSFVGFLQGKTPDLQAIGISMAQSIIQTLLQGILNEIIPSFLEGLAEGLGSILGGGGGGGFGGILGELGGGLLSIFGLHQGGMIEAHGGWPLRYDERIIKVQTGERILSRKQNQEYEYGMGGGGLGGAIININPRYPMSRQETEHMVRTKLIPAMVKQQKRMGGKYR